VGIRPFSKHDQQASARSFFRCHHAAERVCLRRWYVAINTKQYVMVALSTLRIEIFSLFLHDLGFNLHRDLRLHPQQPMRESPL
jgi:hypothetical protein